MGGLWKLVDLLPLFNPLQHDSAKTISIALYLGLKKHIQGCGLGSAARVAREPGYATIR
ncbi:putative P-type H(+)-exporting transporter [Helianthus anomalus]